MPVGAIVGGIATVGGAVVSSNAAKKQANAIQGATDSSNATQLQIYNQQRQDLMPWMNTGKAALSQIEKMLGLAPAGGAAATTPAQTVPPQSGIGGQPPSWKFQGNSPAVDSVGSANALTTAQPVGAPMQVPENASQSAGQFDGFYQSPGYQARLTQGQRQLNTGLASRGQLFSGDAAREAVRFGQDYASNEYGTYLNQLFNVAGMGQTSTGQSNALAGNYANNVSNNNMAAAQGKASSYGTQANSWQNALGTVGGMAMKYWG